MSVARFALVRFVDVGRDKMTWQEWIPLDEDDQEEEELSEYHLVQSIRKHRALMSRDISFSGGTIYAGVRAVGRIE